MGYHQYERVLVQPLGFCTNDILFGLIDHLPSCRVRSVQLPPVYALSDPADVNLYLPNPISGACHTPYTGVLSHAEASTVV